MKTAQMNPQQQNAIARQMLLGAAMPVRKKVGTFSGNALGSTLRVRLLNVGLTTRLIIGVRAQVDITILGVPSAVGGAYNLLNQVRLIDYNQIERVSADAYSLAMVNGFRKRRTLDTAVASIGFTPAATDVNAVFVQPTSVANNQALNFFVDVPFCVDSEMGDLRGLSWSQAVVGEQFVNLKFADALVGTDPLLSPYSSGTMTLDDIVVDVWQEYLIPPDNPAALPLLDLSTAYEIKGLLRSQSDIASGGQKLINYPNVRNVLSSFHVGIDNNTAMDSTDISSLQLLINSSQIMREDSYASMRRSMRNIVRADASSGSFYEDHRQYPISTALYGNVQLAVNFGTVVGGGNTYIASTFESTYAVGSPLPGVTTQG
jgi:hypothetical protein